MNHPIVQMFPDDLSDKSLIGPRLRARGFEAQQTEAAIGVQVLNRMLSAGRPNSVRCKRQAA